MNPSKSIYILGISAFYHDSAAALIRDGEIIAAAQEERFSRKKHDERFPKLAIEYCLKEAGITIKDITHVAYYEKPFIKFERLLFTYLTFAPIGLMSFLKAMPVWLKQKLFLKNYIQEELKFEGDIIFPEHHESHAASAFFPSPFKQTAILTMDGVGEWTTSSLGKGEDNKIELTHEIRFPHSLGLLYSAFTYFTGFRVNSGEYKLMGLAPYGEPKYADLIKRELVDIKEDGSFHLNMKYFNYCAGLTMTNEKFHRLFGLKPRKPESKITKDYMDIASSIQVVTEEIMLKMANFLQETTGMDNLCLAGGVALNCVGNGKILKQSKFKNIWIQPASGDAGGALGAALFTWYQYLDQKREVDGRRDLQKGSYLGPQFDQDEIGKFIDEKKIPAQAYNQQDLAKRLAQIIADEKVVGLVNGRMEFGPRALGARSIIGDARSEKMQTFMNVKIKFRESFRPFAPSVLREKAGDYFEMNNESPYMLLVAPVQHQRQIKQDTKNIFAEMLERLKVKRSDIPAVTHVDYSARVQTVSKETNPFYYQVIEEFNKLTGCPVIINTSFNIRGEPIVCTPQDAYRCFMCTDMDYLVLGNFLLDRKVQPKEYEVQKDEISTVLD